MKSSLLVRSSVLALGATALLAGTSFGAGTASTTFNVTALINPTCAITATNLNFGTYDATSATALDATSTVNAFCPAAVPFTLALDVGTGGGTYVTRQLLSGSDTLDYNLYTTTARTTVWGDGTGATGTVPGTGAGALTAVAKTVYGRIPISQAKPTGTYTSVITATISF